MDVILVLLGVVFAFYFILLRPVLKQQRQRRDDISSLRVGDEVLTSGGFYAIVRDIRTTDSGPMELDLEAAPGVILRAAPQAVERVTRSAEATPELAVGPSADELSDTASDDVATTAAPDHVDTARQGSHR